MQVINYFDIEKSDKPQFNKVLSLDSIEEMQIYIPEGSIIKEHKSPCKIAISLLKGSINLSVAGESIDLEEGRSVIVGGGVLHELKGTKESFVRLSLYKKEN